MPRPREFDADTALESAMQAFWAKGYEATSLDDLCAATGLSRSSLYATFGDKHALLLAAIDRYTERRVDSFLGARFAKPQPIRTAFAAFLDELIDRIVSGAGRRGCFLGNCAAELARDDREAQVRVRAGLSRIEATFEAALTAARDRGEIASKTDTRALARFLMCTTQGLRLIGKANPDRATLEDIKRVALAALDA
jgi:TetR/AcrR family transcriptional regulator, transcriptional repressor for nem operon